MRPALRLSAPTVIATLALVLVVLLANQNRDLEADLGGARRRATFPHAGMYVPEFRGIALTGDSLDVAEGETQLLFVFNTTCAFCRASLPVIQRIAAEVEGLGIRLIGVSLDSLAPTRDYAAEHQLPFPVVRFPEDRLRHMYRTQSVPTTLVVSEDGLVVFAKVGSLTEIAVQDSLVTAVHLWEMQKAMPTMTPDSVLQPPPLPL